MHPVHLKIDDVMRVPGIMRINVGHDEIGFVFCVLLAVFLVGNFNFNGRDRLDGAVVILWFRPLIHRNWTTVNHWTEQC